MAFKICPEFNNDSYFYKMKAVIIFLRWGGGSDPHTRGVCGCGLYPRPRFSVFIYIIYITFRFWENKILKKQSPRPD